MLLCSASTHVQMIILVASGPPLADALCLGSIPALVPLLRRSFCNLTLADSLTGSLAY